MREIDEIQITEVERMLKERIINLEKDQELDILEKLISLYGIPRTVTESGCKIRRSKDPLVNKALEKIVGPDVWNNVKDWLGCEMTNADIE